MAAFGQNPTFEEVLRKDDFPPWADDQAARFL